MVNPSPTTRPDSVGGGGVHQGVGVGVQATKSPLSTVFVSPLTPSNPQTTSMRSPIAVPPVNECLMLVLGPLNHVSVVVS